MPVSIAPVSLKAQTGDRVLLEYDTLTKKDSVFIIPLHEETSELFGHPPWGLSVLELRELGFTGAKGDRLVRWSQDRMRRYVYIGLGKPLDRTSPFSVEETKSAAALAAKTAKKLGLSRAILLFFESSALSLFDICLGLFLGEHEFSRKGKLIPSWDCQFKILRPLSTPCPEDEQTKIIDMAKGVASGVIRTRELVSDGANTINPGTMGMQAVLLSSDAIVCRIYKKDELQEMGAGLILAVGQGSEDTPEKAPALIHMTYRHPTIVPDKDDPEIWVIGKGVTFDSGGLDLKVAPGAMRHMHIDMAGAGACLGFMETLGQLLPMGITVHCVMPVTENMTGPGAYKCGDIHRSLSDKTVEIGNTDAEGRLILADAITFAQQRGAKVIITVATLTGAQMVALGPIAALYANEKAHGGGWVKALNTAAQQSADHVHVMPLDRRLKSMLKSKGGADICNFTGVSHAGAVTVALFLDEFVNEGVAFIHLDISGVAYQWVPLGLHHQENELGTGFGVALMHRFIQLVVG